MSLTTERRADGSTDRRARPARAPGAAAAPALLVARLGEALERAGVRYCQWKGHAKRAYWETGESDVDLLVDRADDAAFTDVLRRLGFKLALPLGRAQEPGLLSWLGHDQALRRPIHIHVHYELVIGRLWARHYRLPIERVVLDSAMPRTWLKTPSPELELLLLVLHSTLRLRARDVLRSVETYWIRALQPGLQRLTSEADFVTLERALLQCVPDVSPRLFARCQRALRPGPPTWRSLLTKRDLERALAAHARTAPLGLKVRQLRAVAARALGIALPHLERTDKHLASGGALIALVGADGAGKTTCAEALGAWLSHELRTRHTHFGRPPRSLSTLACGALLKAASLLAPGATSLLALLRSVGTARDRYRLYRRMRAFQALGGLAICDRFPIPESYALAGPSRLQDGPASQARGRLAEWLQAIEARWYARIGRPDVTVVLRIDPDTAVARKTDEPEPYVRRRAHLLREARWPDSAIVVDAARPLAQVAGEVRARVWDAL